jgi:hypothetical protein
MASALREVECLRTLDRLGQQGAFSPDELAERRTPLGTFDAIHLATAALAGRYLHERELGQRDMATVYLAHDLKPNPGCYFVSVISSLDASSPVPKSKLIEPPLSFSVPLPLL